MYLGDLNHLFFVVVEDNELDECYKSFTSYKYNCCGILSFLLNIVQLCFDLLLKLCFRYFFPFSDPENRSNVWFMKILELDLFLIFPVSYFSVPEIFCITMCFVTKESE